MKSLTKLFVPTTVKIDLDILKMSKEIRFLKSDFDPLSNDIYKLENYWNKSGSSTFEIQSDVEDANKKTETYCFEINIQGSIVNLDYRLNTSIHSYKKLSSILGLRKGYIVTGDLQNESFRDIQNKLMGVITFFTDDYTRIGEKLYVDK